MAVQCSDLSRINLSILPNMNHLESEVHSSTHWQGCSYELLMAQTALGHFSDSPARPERHAHAKGTGKNKKDETSFLVIVSLMMCRCLDRSMPPSTTHAM